MRAVPRIVVVFHLSKLAMIATSWAWVAYLQFQSWEQSKKNRQRSQLYRAQLLRYRSSQQWKNFCWILRVLTKEKRHQRRQMAPKEHRQTLLYDTTPTKIWMQLCRYHKECTACRQVDQLLRWGASTARSWRTLSDPSVLVSTVRFDGMQIQLTNAKRYEYTHHVPIFICRSRRAPCGASWLSLRKSVYSLGVVCSESLKYGPSADLWFMEAAWNLLNQSFSDAMMYSWMLVFAEDDFRVVFSSFAENLS